MTAAASLHPDPNVPLEYFQHDELLVVASAYRFVRARARFALHGGQGTDAVARTRSLYIAALQQLGQPRADRLEEKLDTLVRAIVRAATVQELKQGARRKRRNLKKGRGTDENR